MSLRVAVIAPTRESFHAVAKELKQAGHIPLSTWDAGRENRVAHLSSEQITDLALDTENLIIQSDVVVTIHDRSASGTSRGSSFFAGYAYAASIPVVVVGPYDEVGLHSKLINGTTVDGLNSLLKKFEKAEKAAAFVSSRGKVDAPTNPEQGEDHVGSNELRDSSGPDAGAFPGGEATGADVDEGSHI